MFSVKGDATIATVTDLRRSATQLLERAEAGESVVLQRNAEPVGVLIDFARYQRMVEAIDKLENLELMLIALKREADWKSGREELVSLEDVERELEIAFPVRAEEKDGETV
ncbi:MAG TPA: type II toxin-antitoxin system prevent-host-death family antitoxin [Longimicrobium sp.]|nr:type II toxin-antitoxin system prevent-host-death family antitoxin [Longimicrobium sp.]